MKLSRNLKKILAYVCTIAMVVGLATTYKANSVKAEAPDYSGLEGWKAIGNGSFNSNFEGSEWTFESGSANLPDFFFQSSEILFIAGPTADQLKATLNGISGDIDAAQIHFNDCSQIITYEYNVLEITWNGGAVTVIIHCPNLTGTYEPGEDEPSTEPTTEPETDDPSGIAWKEIGEGYFYDSDTDASIINIQQPGFATERGIYMTVSGGISKVLVNGVEQTDDNLNGIQGAGVVVYLSNLTKKINTVVITYAGGTITVIIQNINGTDDEDGYYDKSEVEDYISNDEYPEKEGSVFAGWYDDENCETPYTGNGEGAYAKYVDEKVLEVGAQPGLSGEKIRFISTIDDSLDYNEVGFYISGKHGQTDLKERKCVSGTTLYRSLKESSEDGEETSKAASEVFGAEEAAYIFTFAVTGLEEDSEWTVTPYWVTADGTTVRGAAKQYNQTTDGDLSKVE